MASVTSYTQDAIDARTPASYVDAHGGAGDGRDVTVSLTSGSATVTAPANTFTSADIGKTAWWWTSGSTYDAATITAVASGTTATLSKSSAVTSTTATFMFGTDNSAAITAALTEAKAVGGTNHLKFGPGLYLTSTTIGSLTYSRDFRISGVNAGGMSYGTYTNQRSQIGTEVRYMSHIGPFLNAYLCRGFRLDSIALRVAHPSFDDAILSIGSTWSSYLQNFLIGGVHGGVNAIAVKDTNTVEAQFTDGMIERCAIGFFADGSYANANTYTRVVWLACDIAMQGKRTQATFLSCVFEPRGGSMTSDPLGDVSPIVGILNGVTFVGCGWWDAIGGTQAWLQPAAGSTNVTLLGCYYEPRTVSERLITPSGAMSGLSIQGLRAFKPSGGDSTVISLGASGSITGLDYRANTHERVVSGLDDLVAGVSYEPDRGASALADHGTVTTALSVRLVATQRAILGGSPTITLPTPAAGAFTVDLYLTQDASGGQTVTWPASVTHDGGSSAITATAGATTHLQLTSLDAGASWLVRAVASYA